MATIITYDNERIQEIVDSTVVDGSVDEFGSLTLERRDGFPIDAGVVKGPKGFTGPELVHNPGHISLYGGSTAPSGWMLCNGAAISRTDYAALFAAIGTKYGVGNGTTTFNIPDLRGRIPVGLDATQTEFDNLGEKGGAKTHTLTEAELPSHTHTVLGYSGVDDKNMTGNVGRMQAADTFGQNNTTYDKPTLGTGGGGAHNNLQPYLTLNYIISIGTAAPQGGGIAVPRYFTDNARGTTSQRDAKYGVPSTSAARVALANQKVVWYNADLGWDESYYEVSGASGLTAIGLVTGATAGWYPIADGPFMELTALANTDVPIDTFISGWSVLRRKGGASWFTLSGTDRINVLKHGRYDGRFFTNQYGNNTATPDYIFKILMSDNATTANEVGGGGSFTKNTSFMTRPHSEFYDLIIAPNSKVGIRLQKGTEPGPTVGVHGGDSLAQRGRLSVKYVGPPLVTD